MSEKSNPTDGERLNPQSGGSDSAPAEEYKVGPGRPPPDRRWKKGDPSPKSPGAAAQATVDGSGREEGIGAGPQQESLSLPRR